MTEHIRYPEEVRADAIEAQLKRAIPYVASLGFECPYCGHDGLPQVGGRGVIKERSKWAYRFKPCPVCGCVADDGIYSVGDVEQ
jgi:hypothetical protein